MAHYIFNVDSSASLLPFMGGKAANLYRLSQHGVPVPQWVCLSSQICSDALADLQPDIDAHLSEVDYDNPDSIQHASDVIGALIEDTKMSDTIRRDIESGSFSGRYPPAWQSACASGPE